MVYTRKTPWPLSSASSFAAYARLVQSGFMEAAIKWLNNERLSGEMITLGYTFGILGVAASLWHLLARAREGLLDYSCPRLQACSSSWGWPSW